MSEMRPLFQAVYGFSHLAFYPRLEAVLCTRCHGSLLAGHQRLHE